MQEREKKYSFKRCVFIVYVLGCVLSKCVEEDNLGRKDNDGVTKICFQIEIDNEKKKNGFEKR